MDDEEAEALLRSLRAHLAKFGAGAADLPQDAPPEDGAALDAREELSSVLDEYEALLIDAPKMLASTMQILGARSIVFTQDKGDERFSRDGAPRSEVDVKEVKITSDDLGEWMEIAASASKLITQIRGRLDDQHN